MRLKHLAPLLATAGLLTTTLPLVSATQAAAAPADSYLNQKPSWQRCQSDEPTPESFECATLKVPLDYQKPDGPTIDLAISRLKSTNPDKRRGVLLINPGGPGAPALDHPLNLVERGIPKEVQEQYDLIGFDPRGVGKSSPITCGLTTPEEKNTDRPYRPETFDSDITWAKVFADKCRQNAGAQLPYITTRNTARDMDTIRTVLGENKISYLGASYGTYLGAVYTQMFPDRTDRFVLDSGVDPARAWRGMQQTWATEAEPAFARWTQWAAEHDKEYGLGDSPQAVADTFWQLVEHAEREPIDMGVPWTAAKIRSAMRQLAFTPSPPGAYLLMGLKAAAEGKPLPSEINRPETKKLLDSINPTTSSPAAAGDGQSPADNVDAVMWAVQCGDTQWPTEPGQYAQDAARDKKAHPLYGDIASNIQPCAFWDKPTEPATPMNQQANVLIVQNQWDAQTPLVSGQGLNHALKGSRMITVTGGQGHILYPRNNCAAAPVNEYLTTGKLPAQNTTCTNPEDTSEPDSITPPNGSDRF
ncbi:alpha/beta hydrolase [Streptomyces vinaceus]|uniref:alpha/beta hydrolase n=1 Tax=Streptomyces vinaceus TaxID=1960 RepID=UPI0036B23120